MDKYTISGLLTEAAKKLRADFEYIRSTNPHPGEKGEEAEEILRQFLNHHLPQRFRAAEGIIIDNANVLSKQTDVIVYDALVSPVYRYSEKTLILPVDTVAAVIEVKSRLNKPDLEDAYKKIASCKLLKKRPPSDADVPATGSDLRAAGTYGVIFGFASDTSLATLAAHVVELSKTYEWRLWPDMILVLDGGMITCSIQFPGERLGGDLMPIDSQTFLIPPCYIHLVLREDGIFTLNRFFTVLLTHLTFYPKRLSTPPFEIILEGAPKEGITLKSFQFDASRRLLPVDVENTKVEIPTMLQIQDSQGNGLGAMMYVPWRDGGVIKWKGVFPLGPLLVAAGLPPDTQVLNRPEFQYSSVIRVTKEEFQNWPALMNPKLQNMKASLVEYKFQHIANEGTAEPYVARLFAGLLGLRDKILNDDSVLQRFDKAYHPIIASILAARKALKEIQASSQSKGEAFAQSTQQLLRELNVAISSAMETLNVLGIDISFLRGDSSQFENGLSLLKGNHPDLAAFLSECRRDWLATFWQLSAAQFGLEVQPNSSGEVKPDDLDRMFDRTISLIESSCVYALAIRLPPSLAMIEIPLAQRKREFPQRFETALNSAGAASWRLGYSKARFEMQ